MGGVALSRVLITGVSGFIGQHLAERLQNDGYEVHGLFESTGSTKKVALDPAATWIASLEDYDLVEHVVKRVQPDFVIHLAAKTEVALSFDNYAEVSSVNYVGTVNLAEANRKLNPNLEAFLMASTMETYGLHYIYTPFTEETPQRPLAPYAIAKKACEDYLWYMGQVYNFPHVILRQTNAYGRRDNDFFVVERIISQMVAGDVCNLGAPEPIRNFLFIDDLVELYATILADPGRALGRTFVTGPNNGITINALAKAIQHKLKWTGELNWNTLPPRVGEIPYLNSNPRKAQRVLGWQPKVQLSEGLDRTIAIWQDKVRAVV